MRALGFRSPELPGPIVSNRQSSTHNANLTTRKYQLEKYLCELLLLLSDRAPLPLLQFLNFQEQLIDLTTNLDKTTEIQLAKATVSVPANQILVNELGKAKINYKVNLSFEPFP